MSSQSDLSAQFKKYRINQHEYDRICSLLKRPPQGVEWAVFSASWSEHCSYKSSRVHLKKFGKTINDKVVNSSGENAGVVDLGQGERIAFKMESHNHPSFIEPYQGAATGVGGILRDIFTMGARPIALADYLCFGETTAPRMKELVDGVVRGISGYGNCVGVPTVTGQTNFDSSYNNNILVNAMAVGYFAPGTTISLSGARGIGNYVVYVGAKTGKDGVHGAAMASESFDEDSESKKPNVQIGDPYYEKLLIESCIEVIQKDLVEAIQDMGAAGLTSSSFEMAGKGNVGLRLNLSDVPLRDSSLTPEEILLSESQERMLLVCKPEKFDTLKEVFWRWGLDAVQVGEIIPGSNVELWWRNEKLTSLDPKFLTDEAPMYHREYTSWKSPRESASPLSSSELATKSDEEIFINAAKSLKSVQHCLRDDIYRQYDQRVGLNTAHGSDYDVAFMRLPASHRGLAVAVGARTQLLKFDAQIGGYDAVLYPALQMAIKGAYPVAVTDCLNFGNPEKNEIMSQFVAAVDAIVDASLALASPVVSGNVSFYNETINQNITPTPAIGMIGLRSDVNQIPEDEFKSDGLHVCKIELPHWIIVGEKFSGKFKSQEFSEQIKKIVELAKLSGVKSTQMVNADGLLNSILKMSRSGFGFTFNESITGTQMIEKKLYEVLFVISEEHKISFEENLKKHQLNYQWIGKTGGDQVIWKKQSIKCNELNLPMRSLIENLA